MGRSLHRRAADAMAEEWARTDDGARRLSKAYLMQRNEISREQVDVWGQPYGGWDMGQLFSLYCLASLLARGHLAVAQFDVGMPPRGDKQRAANQAALSTLPAGIEAWVDSDQRGADQDGLVRWFQSLADTVPVDGVLPVTAAGSAPLEIGNTDASMTCFHLAIAGAVARWPYGQHTLTLLVVQPAGEIQRWRWGGAPSPALEDMADYINMIAASRMFGISLE